ncbi:MAG TPA: hypothetical protein VFT29_11895 [Gemmatimonadaceae bacterium]|nr:hypothetical protein [Gemmatimonadaceae bacterium]
MNAKLVILGTIAGALTLFAWETLSHTALPWHASLAPEMRRSATLLGVVLGRQLVLDLVAAFMVLIVLVRLPRVSPFQCAMVAALMALAVSASVLVSDWNWYGSGTTWILVRTLDRSIGYGLMGLALGAVINRFSGRARTDEWGGVGAPASAYQPNVGSPFSGTPR